MTLSLKILSKCDVRDQSLEQLLGFPSLPFKRPEPLGNLHHCTTMYKHILLLLVVVASAVHAGPLNLFVNVTIDDRPDLDIIEGDIARDHVEGATAEESRNAYLGGAKWTGGLLPYLIDGSSPFSAAHVQTITNSMRRIEQQTNNCIRFVQRTNQPTWLRIFSGSG